MARTGATLFIIKARALHVTKCRRCLHVECILIQVFSGAQVRRVEEELTLRFPDGAKVVMKDVDAQELEQVSKARKLREVSQGSFVHFPLFFGGRI